LHERRNPGNHVRPDQQVTARRRTCARLRRARCGLSPRRPAVRVIERRVD
jgi:hypothetical protein